jgi:hypothetical protein
MHTCINRGEYAYIYDYLYLYYVSQKKIDKRIMVYVSAFEVYEDPDMQCEKLIYDEFGYIYNCFRVSDIVKLVMCSI